MDHYHFIIQADRCVACYACRAACFQENRRSQGDLPRRSVSEQEGVSGRPVYLSMACNHCQNPVCVSICPHNNYTKRRDGVVVHDDTHCEGCKLCAEACPFQAPQYNPVTRKVDKCHFCHERLDEGMSPVCVDACPTDALTYAKMPVTAQPGHRYPGNDVPISRFTELAIVIKHRQSSVNSYRSGGLR